MDTGPKTRQKLAASGLLIDIDGVLRIDDQVVPGAAETITTLRQRGFPLRFLTNTSVRSHRTLCANLVALGLPIEAAELFTAPVATAAYLRRQGKHRVYLVVKGDVVDDFTEFEVTDEAAEAVVIGGAEEEFTYARINRAFQLIMAGAELIAIHRNKYWRTSQGLQVDAGAFVVGLEYVTGTQATIIGKPSAEFFGLALADLGVPAQRVLVVGDDIETDILGSQRLGARAALVRTGKFRPSDLERSDVRPDLVLSSIAELPGHLE